MSPANGQHREKVYEKRDPKTGKAVKVYECSYCGKAQSRA